LSVGYFNSLGTCDLCFQKLPNLKDSNWLPGVFIAGESITNMNNSTNIKKNSKSVLGMPIGTRRRCLMKKTGHEKSRDTVPLKLFQYYVIIQTLHYCEICCTLYLIKLCTFHYFSHTKWLKCNLGVLVLLAENNPLWSAHVFN
jgi:hypothetical protein